ncbi:hypothetical protein HF086_000163 [Spodoptera exigua]|uniref:DNA cross-link repair 1A protein n=1 Tax=Spodoptera exigua TaxID=7107 RepID=A0A922MN92_SPOEX|nr:hypothetical protein HF086_000163 [Spodoptera exigua]
MNDDDINDYVPSLLNPRRVKIHDGDLSLTQNSIISRSSLSLKRNNGLKLKPKKRIYPSANKDKENSQNVQNLLSQFTATKNIPKTVDRHSLGFSAIEDLQSEGNQFESCSFTLADAPTKPRLTSVETPFLSVSSHTELERGGDCSDYKTASTVILNNVKPTISVSFGIDNCQSVDVKAKKSSIKRILFSHNNDNTLVDCEIVEGSQASSESDHDDKMNELLSPNSLKRSAVTVNLEIKKKKPSSTETAENKVLILNTSAIEKISHVIVQPPNYKLVKGKILDKNKFKSGTKKNSVFGFNANNYGNVRDRLKQQSIDSFFPKRTNVVNLKVSEGRSLAEPVSDEKTRVNKHGDEEVMSRNSGVADAIKSDRNRRSPYKGSRIENEASSTHFAVDAFSYGEIPNVKHYFLTHFHSDHYSGLKKSFNKLLFCSKITADLCISRLGVNPKCIHVIKTDETIRIDGVEVTAVEANHCPGAVMLVFTLPNGKTLLHTGDFRASPIMESYPIFWNKDIHTIYLDTT